MSFKYARGTGDRLTPIWGMWWSAPIVTFGTTAVVTLPMCFLIGLAATAMQDEDTLFSPIFGFLALPFIHWWFGWLGPGPLNMSEIVATCFYQAGTVSLLSLTIRFVARKLRKGLLFYWLTYCLAWFTWVWLCVVLSLFPFYKGPLGKF